MNVTDNGFFWDDTIYVHYSGSRLLEDDIIEFIGTVKGLITYESVLGGNITIPEVAGAQAHLAQ